MILVLVETQPDDTGAAALTELSLQALAAAASARSLLGADTPVHALTIGQPTPAVVDSLGGFHVDVVHAASHALLTDYGPDLWGATLADLIGHTTPQVVLAAGSDRCAETMAHAAARKELPLVANATSINALGPGTMEVTRVRWGGSLLERTHVTAAVLMVTVAPHSFAAADLDGATAAGSGGHAAESGGQVMAFEPDLPQSLQCTRVIDRVTTSSGVTLAEAPVVVGGGRGVGSSEGFAALEELADLLGGRVGCSRVVTNNGWRPHSDQVGQTGTAIAPQIYIACGISGAIQHWAGAKGAKHVLAINTDPEANMVARADYAVIADLHEVVPAIIKRLRNR